jgi:hypothetical protein
MVCLSFTVETFSFCGAQAYTHISKRAYPTSASEQLNYASVGLCKRGRPVKPYVSLKTSVSVDPERYRVSSWAIAFTGGWVSARARKLTTHQDVTFHSINSSGLGVFKYAQAKPEQTGSWQTTESVAVFKVAHPSLSVQSANYTPYVHDYSRRRGVRPNSILPTQQTWSYTTVYRWGKPLPVSTHNQTKTSTGLIYRVCGVYPSVHTPTTNTPITVVRKRYLFNMGTYAASAKELIVLVNSERAQATGASMVSPDDPRWMALAYEPREMEAY